MINAQLPTSSQNRNGALPGMLRWPSMVWWNAHASLICSQPFQGRLGGGVKRMWQASGVSAPVVDVGN